MARRKLNKPPEYDMSMKTFSGDDFPESMSEKDSEFYKRLLFSHEALSSIASEDGVESNMIISMIMSAHITFLVNLMDCQHCVAEILADAALQLGEGEEHQGDSKVERAAKMSVHKVKKDNGGTVH